MTVIDVVNRFIVFTTQIEAVSTVFVEFGTCYVLTTDKVLYHLDEKDLQSKLTSLYKKNMYDTAVKIAKNNQYDAEGLSGIFKQYGDHLYSKGNFSGAVEQYIKTIGFLEPSYVIRRFLDSRHTQYLTDYLQSVHKEGKASTDHTTLLLNCFTRLDRTAELKLFLENYKQNNFDIDVAIRVCRKSCIEEALELAKFNNKHDHAVGILIEDLKRYSDAVDFLYGLSYDDAEINLMKYGNVLMENCPDKVIKLLKKLCTDYIAKKFDEPDQDREDVDRFAFRMGEFMDREKATPEDFIHLFSDSKQIIDYIEYLIKNLPTCSKVLYNSLIEHYLTLWKISDEKTHYEQRIVDLIKNSSDFYDGNHVLVLCQTYEFWLGAMLIYEEKKLYNLIVRHYLATQDYSSLYVLCRRLGTLEPTIWLHTLNGLKSNNQVPNTFLQEILQVIVSEKLQSPLQVLSALTAIEKGPNLSSVRHYFTQIFQKEGEIMSQDEVLADKYRVDSETLKKNINALNNEPVEFRGSLCDACHQPLSLPVLFFLCKHSFHQECIRSYSETEKDCMVCRKKNVQINDMMHKQNETRNKNNVFKDQMSTQHEPFSVIADYYGKGLFNKILLVNDEDDEVKEQSEDLNIPKKPNPRPPVNPLLMTEGKMRLEESLRTNVDHRAPLSEGRMRMQEQTYKSKPKPVAQSVSTKAFKKKTEVKAAVPVNYPIAANPFDSEEDETNPFGKDEANYDDAKNPFADDAGEFSSFRWFHCSSIDFSLEDAQDVVSMMTKTKPRKISTNPFGDDDAD